MPASRTIALSLTFAALAALGAGCQGRPSAASAAVADNTAEICNAFRHFEVDHQGAGDSLGSFHGIWADGMTKLADRATDPTVSAQLRAVAAQVTVLAEDPSADSYDDVERANPEVFAAGGKAWVSLEARCGAAVIPAP